MAETKKNIMTFAGLRALEDELFDLKVYKRKEVAQKIKEARDRATFPKMLSTMQLRTSREISKHVSKNLRTSEECRSCWPG
mgnify:CR=1 FL=1